MNKLSIVVPFRDREEHLRKFLPHMNYFLTSVFGSLEFKIFIIEQNFDKPFNRGKLINVGFKESKKDFNYFCFHDVDMLPSSNSCDYSYIEGACRLSHYVSQFGFKPRPKNEIGGGILLVDKSNFEKINGFSNSYWGWGAEDNDFYLRCQQKSIPMLFREGRYMSLEHEPNGDTGGRKPSEDTLQNRKTLKYFIDEKKIGTDGLSDLDYQVLGVERLTDFCDKIKVVI